MARIFLSPPDVGSRERELLLEAFDSNWIAPIGPHLDRFESECAEVSDRKYAVALSSGTAALHLALRYFGVERGDTVLTSTLTFAATANAIRYQGAEPIFIDSTHGDWNMDPALLDEALRLMALEGKLPKAIVPVDLYGQCANYHEIVRIAREYEIPVVADAAESLGAFRDGCSAGASGQAAVFSFNGNKIITTSGGGMLVTDDQMCAKKVRFWATQARDPAQHYEHSELGYNYRLSNLLAALGSAQLLSLSRKVNARRENNSFYRDVLSSLPGVQFMPEASGARSTFWLTTLCVEESVAGVSRDAILLALQEENIEARPVWKPMHMQPLYRDCRLFGGQVSQLLFDSGLCLPSGSNLGHDRDRVAEVVATCFS